MTRTITLPRFHVLTLTLLVLIALLPSTGSARQARDLEWLDLLPESDRDALQRLPETMAELNEDLLRSGPDELTGEVRMPDVLSSTKVRAGLAGDYVRLPGFLVPLERNERGDPFRFFLVPYFGACIHSPPPPPNQIVHVQFSGGLPHAEIYTPYRVTGELEIEQTSNELGLSTYTIEADAIHEF